MKTLYNALGKNNIINKITADNFEQAISKAYSDDNYKFFHNSELLDVKDRFRIFRYKDVNYIIKSMGVRNGKIEFDNTMSAAKLLNGKKINDYSIEVIELKMYIVNENYYIASEYKGNTLHECFYTRESPNFTLNDFQKLLELFSELGIEYPGFCPRNMVVSKEKKKIYLFDFENAKFSKKIKYYNMFYKTNIFVNWSYFYKLNVLINIINKLQSQYGEEPKLNTYEKSYKKILGFLGNDLELRKNIMNVVLSAEEKIDISNNNFCLLPIDMASIISDLFDFDMDVIMDMTFYVIRKISDKFYQQILLKFNDTIIYAYKNNLELKKAILPLLLFSINNVDLNQSNIIDFKLLDYYFTKNKYEFYKELKNKLEIVFKIVYPYYKESNLDVENLSEHLLKLYM